MFEWLREPGFFGTHATVGADISQLMATLFTGLFVIGWFQARRHRADAHHWMMFGGMIAMLAFFISYYLFRQLGVLAFEGKEGFGGSEALYHNVFIPILIVHIVLVVVGLVMAVYMIVLGFRAQLIEQGRRILSDRVLQTTWGKIGMIFGIVCLPVALYLLYLMAVDRLRMGRISRDYRRCVRRGDDDPASVARRRAPPPSAWTVHDGHLLHFVCDRNHHLHDAVSFVSGKDRMSGRVDIRLRRVGSEESLC
jgi:uncharacterized membrane protein YozB (DUF420 family)